MISVYRGDLATDENAKPGVLATSADSHMKKLAILG
jgi:hypothetical protein